MKVRLVNKRIWTFAFALFSCCHGLRAGGDEILPTGEYEITVFLSEIGAVGDGVELANPIVSHFGTGGTETLFVWIDPGEVKLDGASFRVRSAVPGIIEFRDPVFVYNPDLLWVPSGNDSGFDRWTEVGDSRPGRFDSYPDETFSFLGINAFSNAPGIDPALDGSSGLLDPLYDVSAGAVLFAKVDYDVLSVGSTSLYLEVGKFGVTHDFYDSHSSDVSVYFGDGELLRSDALNAWSQRLVPSTLPDAIINVLPEELDLDSESVPEPGGVVLLMLGVASLLFTLRAR